MVYASFDGGFPRRKGPRTLDGPTVPTIADGLRARFTSSTRDVLKPLFAGITIDPSLSERMAFADFAWGAMAHGQMVVPSGGIAAVPQQLASRLSTTQVHLSTAVSSVSATSVMVDGEERTYDRVVLAVPQHVALTLHPALASGHQPVERLTSTVAFAAPEPPYSQARLMVNEAWDNDEHRVLHVHVPTNLHRHANGEHWVVATLVGEPATSPDASAVQQELRTWFGESVDRWQHVATTTVRHALPHIDPSHHRRAQSDVEVNGVLVVGDHRTHPSVQGALRSAERALKHLNIPLPRRPDMTWHNVMKSSKLKPGKKKMMTVKGKMVMVGRQGTALFATEALCRHMRWPLAWGAKVEDDCVRCPFTKPRTT